MSRRWVLGAWVGLSTVAAAGCAGWQSQETAKVILAGSVCSAEPPLEVAAAPQPAAPNRPSTALVAYVAEPGPGRRELVVYDLAQGRERFHVPVALRTRPEILTDTVVAVDDQGQLRGYDLQSGALRFQHKIERESWLGAVQVGDHIVYTSTSLSFRPAERGSTVTALAAQGGAVAWRRDVPYVLSKPHIDGARVLLLSDHADVWALAADSGRSAGCARLGAESLDWIAPGARGALLIGARDARQLQPARDARQLQPRQDLAANAPRLAPPLAELPGQPALHPSSYDSVPAGRSAQGRVGVEALLEPGPSGPVLRGGHYFFVFYRELFAYHADGQLAWARLLSSDAVRVRSVGDALLVITEGGEISWLRAADGAQFGRYALPARVTSADVLVTQPALESALASAVPGPALRPALREIALDTDARLLPGRRLAASALAALPEPEATRDLLDVYVQPAAPVELKRHVAAVLAERKRGSDYLVSALDGDYDFLSGTPAPPLAAIVPGLVKNNEARAVPRLIDRLFDADTQLSELSLLVDAIATLGGAAAQKPLSQFLALYHADSSLADDPAALLRAASVLWTAAAANDVKLVQSVAHDPATIEALRTGLVPLLATAEPVAAPEPVAANAGGATEEVKPKLPQTLSDQAIASTFAAHAAELRECVSAELAQNPSLRALRFNFVVNREGTLSRLEVWPKREQLASCITPKLQAARFPAFVRGPRMASYTLLLHPQASAKETTDAKTEPQPFWFHAQLRAAGIKPEGSLAPWWQNQNPLFVAVDEPAAAPAAPAANSGQSGEPEPSPGARAQDAQQRAIMKRTEEQQREPPASGESWWVPTQEQ